MNIHSSLILMAKNEKQRKCPLAYERNKKWWYIHTKECTNSEETHEPLQTTCTNLKSITLSERRQMQKAKTLNECTYMKFRKRAEIKSVGIRLGMGEETVYKEARWDFLMDVFPVS